MVLTYFRYSTSYRNFVLEFSDGSTATIDTNWVLVTSAPITPETISASAMALSSLYEMGEETTVQSDAALPSSEVAPPEAISANKQALLMAESISSIPTGENISDSMSFDSSQNTIAASEQFLADAV